MHAEDRDLLSFVLSYEQKLKRAEKLPETLVCVGWVGRKQGH